MLFIFVFKVSVDSDKDVGVGAFPLLRSRYSDLIYKQNVPIALNYLKDFERTY